MGKFVAGVLVAVLIMVGAFLGYNAWKRAQEGSAGPPAANAPQPPPPPVTLASTTRTAADPVTPPPPPPPGVTAAGLMADYTRARDRLERQAAYEKLAAAFPASAEAARAREALAREHREAADAWHLRNVLSDMLWRGLSETRETEIKRELVDLNKDLIFSPRKSPDGEIYTIRPGDAVEKIARHYKITGGFVGRINRLKDVAKIRFGDTLKVVNGPFDVLVEVGKYRLTVLLRGRFVKEYRIGVGKDESTPLGRFTVKDKLVNPTWYGPDGEVKSADDPQNPLGERWIGITGGRGYGIHGTIEPESIGTACSRGCIRMLEKDIDEVYDFVVPELSRVTMVE